jgi:rubredoxin
MNKLEKEKLESGGVVGQGTQEDGLESLPSAPMISEGASSTKDKTPKPDNEFVTCRLKDGSLGCSHYKNDECVCVCHKSESKPDGSGREKYLGKCGHTLHFSEIYDSYFCPVCNIWTENKCHDENCVFCKKRPEKPSDVQKGKRSGEQYSPASEDSNPPVEGKSQTKGNCLPRTSPEKQQKTICKNCDKKIVMFEDKWFHVTEDGLHKEYLTTDGCFLFAEPKVKNEITLIPKKEREAMAKSLNEMEFTPEGIIKSKERWYCFDTDKLGKCKHIKCKNTSRLIDMMRNKPEKEQKLRFDINCPRCKATGYNVMDMTDGLFMCRICGLNFKAEKSERKEKIMEKEECYICNKTISPNERGYWEWAEEPAHMECVLKTATKICSKCNYLTIDDEDSCRDCNGKLRTLTEKDRNKLREAEKKGK